MGPIQRYLGPEVPSEVLLWQDPLPGRRPRRWSTPTTSPRSSSRCSTPGSSIAQLVSTAWASASTFRGSDKRGGANGARIRLEPQSGWEANDPDQLATVLRTLAGHRGRLQRPGRRHARLARRPDRAGRQRGGREGRAEAGYDVEVPFTPGRTDATQEQTDVESFAALEPTRRRVPQLPRQGPAAPRRVPPGRPGQPAHADRARDDGARRWPAGARRQPPAARRSACSPTGPAR